jgi:hypothetical protein
MVGAYSVPRQARGLARMLRRQRRGAACSSGPGHRAEGEPGYPGQVTIFDFLDDLIDRMSGLFRENQSGPAEPDPDDRAVSGGTAARSGEGSPRRHAARPGESRMV